MNLEISEECMLSVLGLVPERPFNTADFIEVFSEAEPSLWNKIVTEYGKGGKGAGKHYTSYSRLSQALNGLARKGLLTKLGEYRGAPKELNWGSPVIRYWTDHRPSNEQLYPDSASDSEETKFPEGAKKLAYVNRYERSYKARERCKQIFGAVCQACDLDFETRYGERGRDFIHVHHLTPLNEIDAEYHVDPAKDLIPVCPNCHAMIHRFNQTLSINELREIIRLNRK